MFVLLDTNVVSELIRKSPNPAVEAWAASYALEDLLFSTIGETEITAARRFAGRPIESTDGYIAAIAYLRNMPVATRNVRDFDNLNIEIVDPWSGR